MRRSLWICLALAAFTVALYAPALRCQFISFDDPVYVSENQHVRAGLTLPGLAWAFRATTGGNWHPLTMLSHMLDCQIYGLRPWGHHLTSVLFHAANVALIFLVLMRMTGAAWRSAGVALLFAAHPAHVESVAWVSERKDVLCAFFCLLSIWAYVRWAEHARRGWIYALALLFFAMALMSKPMAVTLPFVLLLLDFWPLARIPRVSMFRLIVEKTPMFALTALWCGITVWAQGIGQAVATEADLSVAERVTHTSLAYLNYLRVLAFPWHLSAYYPYKHGTPWRGAIEAAAALALITLLAAAMARRQPYFVVGWLWFLGMLVPVIGLVQVGGQGWADRYAYLPSIGFFVIVVWAAAELAARLAAVKLLIPAAVVALAAATIVELQYWKDTGTLFARAMKVTANNYLAMTLVGNTEENQGHLDKAVWLYRHALAVKPIYPEAHFFLGRALENEGQINAALSEYKEALRLRPDFAPAHTMLGLLLSKENKLDEAIRHYQAALKSEPESDAAQTDWGMALALQGRWQESIAHYKEAVRWNPASAEAHSGLGLACIKTGNMAEGTAELRAALKLNPSDAQTRSNLGQALNQQQQWAEAAEYLRPLAESEPSNSVAQFQYGLDLEHLGQTREAVNHYEAALRQNPDLPDALQHCAWIAATDSQPGLRDGAKAVRMAARACELTGQKRPSMLLTLAAAYAEAGRFGEAVSTAEKAENFAEAAGQTGLAAEAAQFRASFAAGRPFHGGQSK
ncbi:MAG TPA: tetratricopeptide repeat protein [Verrucomicrobiae bacterium]|jgi:tetratricopeptide (TPR) repeat protein